MTDSLFTDDVKLTPYWWDHVPRPALAKRAPPAKADVVVIGSGYTGLGAALQTARGGRDTVVLDAQEQPGRRDDRGILTGLKRYTQADAIPVSVATQTTPSPGTEASFMQQLIGNIGKFNPAGTGTPAGGAAPAGGL